MSATGTIPAPARTGISTLYTLGPTGTNCERAARAWLHGRGIDDDRAVRLFPTLEEGVGALPADPAVGLLACVVYPLLHEIVFSNLDRLRLVDSFVMDTYDMVLATRAGERAAPAVVASHPAPAGLVPPGIKRVPATSNAAAALACASGEVDACVTTGVAAAACGLEVVRNFGPVPMGFTVHEQLGRA